MRGRLLALAFSDHYVYAGVGTIIDFPGRTIGSASLTSSSERLLTAR